MELHQLDMSIMPELPLEIIKCDILPKLPATSLVRFMCVSKQWHSFLSSQEFARMYLLESRAHPKLLLFDSPSGTFRTLDCEEPNYPSTTIRPIPFEAHPKHVLYLGSLDGLVCVAIRNTPTLMFWNPLTGAYKMLFNRIYYGRNNGYPDAIGFYMDSSNDYKLLRVNRRFGGSYIRAYIYSGRLDRWREIEFLGKAHYISNYEWSPVTFSGKSLYFTVSDGNVGGETLIIGFDVNSEKFREIRFPPVQSGAGFRGSLVDVKGCIYLCVADRMSYDSDMNIDLWRMEGEGWMKVAGYSDIDSDVRYTWLRWTPIYIMRNGNWLMIGEDNTSVYKIDMKTNDCVHLYHIGLYHDSLLNTNLQHAVYTQSLVSPFNNNNSS